MTENSEKTTDGQKCKFLEIEEIQNKVHEICSSPKMIKTNKPKNGRTLPCIEKIGSGCGCAEYE